MYKVVFRELHSVNNVFNRGIVLIFGAMRELKLGASPGV